MEVLVIYPSRHIRTKVVVFYLCVNLLQDFMFAIARKLDLAVVIINVLLE